MGDASASLRTNDRGFYPDNPTKKLVLRHGLNPDDHQQECLYIDQTPIIIKYAWTLIKSQSISSRMLGHGLNCSNHHQECLDMDQITVIIM